jgi:hypothetical protein
MKNNEPKKFVPKKTSPFVGDPFNNRSGQSGKSAAVVVGNVSVKKTAKASAPKRKGGSGGDR